LQKQVELVAAYVIAFAGGDAIVDVVSELEGKEVSGLRDECQAPGVFIGVKIEVDSIHREQDVRHDAMVSLRLFGDFSQVPGANPEQGNGVCFILNRDHPAESPSQNRIYYL
jgi:hypothetical protein